MFTHGLSPNKFMSLFSALSYGKSEQGICFGIAGISMQIILQINSLDDSSRKSYLQRLKIINKYSPEELVKKICEAEQKRLEIITQMKDSIKNVNEIAEKEASLTREDPEYPFLTSMRAFFEGIAVYYQPEKYPHIFEEKLKIIPQNVGLVLPILFPEDKKSESVSIKKITESIMVLMDEENRTYFELLNITLRNLKLEHPVSFLIGGGGHTININWHPIEQQWSYFDSEFMEFAFALYKTQHLTTLVKKTLTENENIICEIAAFAHQSEFELVSNAFLTLKQNPTWIKLHEMSPDKIAAADSDGTTWLYIAASNGKTDSVQRLLDSKADPDTKSSKTPLQVAAIKNHSTVVQYLVNAKANPNKHHNEMTPLFLSMYKPPIHMDIVKVLLNANADPYLSPTHITGVFLEAAEAASKGEKEIFELIRHYAPEMSTTVSIAKMQKLAEKQTIAKDLEQFLVSKNLISIEEIEGFTLLHEAIIWGREDVAIFLISAGIPANCYCADGMITTWELAKALKKSAILKFLSERPDVNNLKELADELKIDPTILEGLYHSSADSRQIINFLKTMQIMLKPIKDQNLQSTVKKLLHHHFNQLLDETTDRISLKEKVEQDLFKLSIFCSESHVKPQEPKLSQPVVKIINQLKDKLHEETGNIAAQLLMDADSKPSDISFLSTLLKITDKAISNNSLDNLAKLNAYQARAETFISDSNNKSWLNAISYIAMIKNFLIQADKFEKYFSHYESCMLLDAAILYLDGVKFTKFLLSQGFEPNINAINLAKMLGRNELVNILLDEQRHSLLTMLKAMERICLLSKNNRFHKVSDSLIKKYFSELNAKQVDMEKLGKQIQDTFIKLNTYFSNYNVKLPKQKSHSEIDAFLIQTIDKLYDESDLIAVKLLLNPASMPSDFLILSQMLFHANKAIQENTVASHCVLMKSVAYLDKYQDGYMDKVKGCVCIIGGTLFASAGLASMLWSGTVGPTATLPLAHSIIAFGWSSCRLGVIGFLFGVNARRHYHEHSMHQAGKELVDILAKKTSKL